MVDVHPSGSMLPSVDAFVTASVDFHNEEKSGSKHDHDLLDGLLDKPTR
jgi:hypothetical protein